MINDIKKLASKFKNGSSEVKASIAYTICGILQKGLSFITLPLFTRILTTEDYGLSTIYSSTMALLIIFTSLQLPYGTLNTAMVKYKDDRDGYISSITGLCTVLSIVFMSICIVFYGSISKLFNLPLLLFIIMGFEMLMSTSQMLWMGKQRFEFKYKGVVLVTLVSSAASVVVSIIAVMLSADKGTARVVSSSLVAISFGLLFYIINFKNGHLFFDKKYWKFALSFNVPLIPYYLSQMIFNQSDRLMIDSMVGRSEAAIYGVAYSLATVLTFVISAINSSYVPWAMKQINANTIQNHKKVSVNLMILVSVMLMSIVALAPEVITIVASDKYATAIWVVPPVVMSMLLMFMAGLFDCYLFLYEKKLYLLLASILPAVLNIVLNYIFIKLYGFIAAGYTTLASYIVFAYLDYYLMKRTIKNKGLYKNPYDMRSLNMILLIFVCLGFMFTVLYNFPYIRYAIIIIILLALVIFRKKIKTFIVDIQGTMK